MKILKIITQKIGDEQKIVVFIEGYPHAQPVFDANITPKDLELAIKEWAVKQDKVDALNAQATPVPTPQASVELKALEGTEI